MAEINFGLIDTQAPARIANALMPSPEQQGAQALQVMQMQQAARQGQVSQMQLQKMKQDAEGVAEFSRRVAKLGGPSDPMEIAQAYLAHPDPEHKKFGLELLRKTQDVAKFTSIMGRRLPGADMSPSVALQPGSFGADVAARREAELQRTNMLPGAAAAPAGVNAMAAGNAAQIAFKQQQRDDLIGMGTTQSIAAAKAIDADIALLAKEPSYQNVPGVGLVNPRDRSVVVPSVETLPNSIRELQEFMKMTPAAQTTFMNMKRAGASSQVNTVKLPAVESEYSKTFAKDAATEDRKLLTAARGAPKVAATANRIMEMLNKPDVFVGPAATVKLNIARALSVLGATDNEAINNTEKLIAASGQATLDAIDGANLGTGQGFTDKDLRFLQGVAGGHIDLTAENLRAMARLQQRAAELSVSAWTSRRANMPESATKGTGLANETYNLPPRVGGPTPEAIAYLKANPNTKAAFDARYGDGEAAHTLRMGR